MFCPKCGGRDQSPETYCRQCGTFLPDLSKAFKKNHLPEEHVKVNMVLSSLTIAVSFTLAAMLYTILAFRPETHWLIYLTAGLLIAMGAWHIQTLWRTLLLKKHLKMNKPPRTIELEGATLTGSLLDEPNLNNVILASVTERSTKSKSKPRSS